MATQSAFTYLENVSVMIVDEQPFMARLQFEMLRCLGCRQIHMFNDPVSTWKFFLHTPVDIIITGWRMNPIDGIEFTKMLRTDAKSPNRYVPIIMVTGFGEEDKVQIARDAGVNEYLIKPLSPKSLFLRIESVIERPRRFVKAKGFFGPDRRRMDRDFDGPDRRASLDDDVTSPKSASQPENDSKADPFKQSASV